MKGYFANFDRYGHLDQIDVIVIPDEKTPPAAYDLCSELGRGGMKISCPTLAEQDAYLAGIGLAPAALPRNSDNRRNVGYLMAYASGVDFLISIDDDNYCLPDEDFFAQHAAVCCDEVPVELVDSATGFFNICNLLVSDAAGKAYPRGFPFHKRHLDEAVRSSTASVPIHINAGLWTLDPDIDAISWLVLKPHVTGFHGRSVALGPNAWTPINTQNTALRRAAIPAYYFIRMGYPISGLAIDRYGDILSGYFAQACARRLGGYIRVGTPIAEHKRNSHNYMKDAAGEWGCILTLEDLLPWLTAHRLEGNSYVETFESLSHAMEDAVETMRGSVWTDATRGYFHQTAYYMRLWARACRVIGG